MRWMAVDHGTRRLGIAFSDETETIATPWGVWPNEGDPTVLRLAELARDHEVGAIVVGLPRHDDGNESATAPQARALAAALRKALLQVRPGGVPVILRDEGHTSREADRRLSGTRRPGPGRPRPRDGRGAGERAGRDAAAAAVLLEDLIATRRSRAMPEGETGPDEP